MFDSSYFHGKSHFEDNGTQNCLVFQPVANSNKISEWKSKGLPDESIKPPTASKNSFPAINHINTKLWVKFDRKCLKQEKVTFSHDHG